MELPGIKEIAVIGSGTMGPGIAQTFARYRYPVQLCDQSEAALQKARAVIRANLQTLAEHRLVEPGEMAAIEGRITFTGRLADAAGKADLVVECISEDREAKRTLFQRLGEICAPDTIFASNTSYLNIFQLVPADRLPYAVIAHWFAPPHILPLVEVVRESATSEATVRVVVDLLRKCGKVPVVMAKYVPGFAINRILRIIGREVFFLLDNGYITAEQLDLAVKASIAPRMMLLGVVQRYDFTGLDLSAKNLQNEQFLEPPIDNKPKSLFNLVEQGHLGVKTGRGFFDYQGASLEEILAERDDQLLKILECAGLGLESVIGRPPKPTKG
jgi:3-hydroxybutyryl-CoA dehydrogenase